MAQARMAGTGGYADSPGLSLPGVLGLLTLVGLIFAIWRNASRFPSWLRQDATALLHRKAVHLTMGQTMWLVTWGMGLLLTLLVVVLLVAWIRGRVHTWLNRTPLYDQRLVQEKTMRVAYRARLRIIAVRQDGQETHERPCDELCNAGARDSLLGNVQGNQTRKRRGSPQEAAAGSGGIHRSLSAVPSRHGSLLHSPLAVCTRCASFIPSPII